MVLAMCCGWKNTGKNGEGAFFLRDTAEEEHPEERPGHVYRSSVQPGLLET
jgi:hypothetical protein